VDLLQVPGVLGTGLARIGVERVERAEIPGPSALVIRLDELDGDLFDLVGRRVVDGIEWPLLATAGVSLGTATPAVPLIRVAAPSVAPAVGVTAGLVVPPTLLGGLVQRRRLLRPVATPGDPNQAHHQGRRDGGTPPCPMDPHCFLP